MEHVPDMKSHVLDRANKVCLKSLGPCDETLEVVSVKGTFFFFFFLNFILFLNFT